MASKALLKKVETWEKSLGNDKFPDLIHQCLSREEKPCFYCREIEELCRRCKDWQEMFGEQGCDYPEKCSKPCERILKLDSLAEELLEQFEPFAERAAFDFCTQLGDNPHYNGHPFSLWDWNGEKNRVDKTLKELEEDRKKAKRGK